MTNIVPLDQAAAHVPAVMRNRMSQGLALNTNFQEGVKESYPLLSIKGRQFSVRMGGESRPIFDPVTRLPVQYLDVIMVNGSRALSKTFYVKGYAEGDLNPPDCWSLDSIRPDPSVVNKVSISCLTCPMNAFGSKVTPAGKPAKACQDARRIAVLMPSQLGDPNPIIMLLRVPQSSLKNLKLFAQLMEKHGLDTAGIITRMQFDFSPDVAYPKLVFNYVGVLNDPQYAQVLQIADGPFVSGMLQAPDFENAPTGIPAQNPQTGPVIQGMAPQVGPVIGDAPHPQANAMPAEEVKEQLTQVFGQFNAQQPVSPAQQVVSPVQQAGLIELPDGKLFNPATGQYVERAAPAVDMPQPDPNTLTLPDGKYFNTVSKKFVAGPHIGAPAVEAPTQPTTRDRKGKAKAESAKKDGPQATAQVVQMPQQAATIVPVQAAPETQAPVNSGENKPEQSVGNGDAHAGAHVAAAPADLESILGKLIPGSTKQ